MKTKIGGQAVLEGVMMRGESSMALSVRDENGNIRVETSRLGKKPWYRKVPFLRGVINLVVSLVSGMKTISKSAEVFAEDELDDEGMGATMLFSVVLGIALAGALFILLPTKLADWIMQLANVSNVRWARSLIEGGIKLLVLVGYMLAITLMEDIRRVFMYHGAEHKTIACFEAEIPLTAENVKKCSRYHDRCGTSFIVHVVLLSVLLMAGVDAICYANGFDAIEKTWVRVLIKLAMLPLTAGLSYEVLMLLAKTNFFLFAPLKWLGKAIQRLTTREPDDSMIEVAICSFNKVLAMDADQSLPEEHFPTAVPFGEFKTALQQKGALDGVDESDFDWICCTALNVKRDKLKSDLAVKFGTQNRIENYLGKVKNGEPLQYVLGNQEFYGRTFAVNRDVLIPRPETELVAEQVVKLCDKNSNVLDLCCGSGAIGITVAKETNATVTLTDVSEKAVKTAKQNAKTLKAKVKCIVSDMFTDINGTFDVIVCNPPYIETAVIDTLDEKVKNYEPHLALDGGEDGLTFYRILAQQSAKYLNQNGALVLEIGYNQGKTVAELLQQNGYNVQVQKDYSQNDRIVIAKLN